MSRNAPAVLNPVSSLRDLAYFAQKINVRIRLIKKIPQSITRWMVLISVVGVKLVGYPIASIVPSAIIERITMTIQIQGEGADFVFFFSSRLVEITQYIA